MIKYLFTLLFIQFGFILTFAQSQDKKWAEEHFENKYVEQEYKKSKNKIKYLSENFYTYKEDTISAENNAVMNMLISNNLLFPLYNNSDKISRTYFFRNLKEINSNLPENTKRFSFWLNSSCIKDIDAVCISNPRLYYIEIKSTLLNHDNLSEFYKNSKLTYLGKGGIIL